MSVGIVIKGRNVVVTVGSAKLIGVLSKNISFNGEPFDTTDDDALGWQQLSADHMLKSLEAGFSGLLKNLELVGVYFGASQAAEIIWTFPDGGTTITFDGVMGALSVAMDSNGGATYDTTFKSSGVPVYVAAT